MWSVTEPQVRLGTNPEAAPEPNRTVYVSVYVRSPKPWVSGGNRTQAVGKNAQKCTFLGKIGILRQACKAGALPAELWPPRRQ